jgi:carboxymethylenebutenolidase
MSSEYILAQHSDVHFDSGGARLAGYLALPDGRGPHPALVAIHELYGLNANMRSVADRFAHEGYAALAVDLFAGRNRALCLARLMSGMFLNSLDHSGLDDLRAALAFLTARPEVDASRVGAIGFCMGGSLAIAWACTDDRLRAIAPFYGFNPRPLSAAARSCPVVGSYPEKDFTRGAGEKLAAELTRHGIRNDVKVYPGARHSFFNEDGRAYDPAASADAWRRVLEFFGRELGHHQSLPPPTST